jgi:hypothetical protein
MPRGGARPGAGRKPKPKLLPGPSQDKIAATQLIDHLNRPASADDDEVKGWRVLWDAADLRIRLDTRKYLYDKRDGKSVHRSELSGKENGPIQVAIITNAKIPQQ